MLNAIFPWAENLDIFKMKNSVELLRAYIWIWLTALIDTMGPVLHLA